MRLTFRDANQKLQDTNEGLRSIVVSTSKRSPGRSRRSEVLNLYTTPGMSSESGQRPRPKKSSKYFNFG